MTTYVMLTRLSPEALTQPGSIEELNRRVESRIREEVPDVRWIGNYAILGPCDYLDIFEAPRDEDAQKVALLIRSFGHATTETWTATPWDRFVKLSSHLGEQILVPHTP